MINVSLFFKGEIKDTNILAKAGDFCLTPIRYLFNGYVVKINFYLLGGISDKAKHVHHDYFYENYTFWDGRIKRWLKTLAMIALFAPGLIVGSAIKVFAYLESDMRNSHRIAKKHFTPLEKMQIGSHENRLSIDEIQEELLTQDRYNRPVKNIVVYGNEGEAILGDPGFISKNPNKIILIGPKIIHDSYRGFGRPLNEQLVQTGKWAQGYNLRTYETNKPKTTTIYNITPYTVDSVEDALEHKPPLYSKLTGERYHAVYQVEPATN